MEYIRKISHSTSVKEINIIKEATNTEVGIADFKYRPVFSVFDIGTIIPPLELDNSTINLMQAFNFKILKENEIETHYLGLIGNNFENISIEDAISKKLKPTISRVKFVNRLAPTFIAGAWDYSNFKNTPANNFVLPLEFISRNILSKNSSVWKRIEDGELKISDLNLPDNFKKGDSVPKELAPILDFSTKFEPDDRYVSKLEALNILGVNNNTFDKINKITVIASKLMTSYAESRDFVREDGKVEYIKIFEEGVEKILLADAVCTWHEDRLLFNGFNISKQLIRNKIKELNPKWYEEIQLAKKQAKHEGHDDFRKLMNSDIKYISPEPIFFENVNNVFRAATNQWLAEKIYDIYPSNNESIKDNLCRAIEDFISNN